MMPARPPLVILAHNIRSIWNVGSIFRSADAFGVSHIHLSGYTAVPPRKEIGKTALGAQEWIPWSYSKTALEVIESRRNEGFEIVALEKTSDSIPITDFTSSKPVCLILGHEVLGVSDELIKCSDSVIHIPMHGKKESLNVAVACGIALFALSGVNANMCGENNLYPRRLP